MLVDVILSLGYATAAGESESGQSNEMAAERILELEEDVPNHPVASCHELELTL